MARALGTKTLLALALGLLFAVLSVVVVVLVNTSMKRLALTDAEDASRMLLDHNLAIHTYFSKDLKPKLFDKLGPITSKDYFEPVWMSSTYAIRKMDKYFHHFNPSPYYYKECAINARSPENEADKYEKAFLEDLQNDPQLTAKSAIRVLDGKPYFTLLRRGEAMDESCLRCHSLPEKAPGDLVRYYGPERSFHRKVDEVVQAISIRIPLSEAFSSATRFSYFLSGLLLLVLGGGFFFVWVGNKRLMIDPIGKIREQAVRIAAHPGRLGETIPAPRIRELRDLVGAFNQMSVALRQSYDQLEQRVLVRTQELVMERERLAVTLRSIGDGVISTDIEGRVMGLNRQAEEMTGWTEAEALGRPLQEVFVIVNEKTREPCENPVERVLKTGEIVGLANSTLLIAKDGTERILADSGAPIKAENGELLGAVLVFRDVTERVRAEERLRASEARYRSLFEHMSNAVVVYRADRQGEDFVFVDFNAAAERIEKVEKREVIGQSVLKIFPSVKQFGLFEVLQRVFRTGQPEHHPVAQYKDDRIEGWRENFVYGLPSGEIVAVYSDETERKRAEHALRESEEKFSIAFQFAPMPMAITSAHDGRVVEVNEAFVKGSGYERQEVLGKTAVELGTWKDENERALRLEQIQKEGALLNLEMDFPTKDGTLRHGLFSAVMIRLQGKPMLLSAFNDITEQKKSEQALKDREQMLRSVITATPVGLCLTQDRIIKWANAEWERMFGFNEESEYLGRPTSIMYAEEAHYMTSRKDIYRNLETGTVGETYTEFTRKDGARFQGYVRSTYLAPTDPEQGTLSAISDVTEITLAKEARRESEERYRILCEDSRDAVFVTSREGRYIDVNQAFCDLFGYDRNELESIETKENYADPGDRRIFQETIEKTGSIKDYPMQLRKKDGTIFDALLTASVRYGDKGESLGYQGIIRDMTETKQLEKQLLQAQKMEAIGTLAGGIAHDFNNLLQVVLGYSELILADKQPNDPDYADLHKIRGAARNGAELVKQILTFSKRAEISPRPIDLNREVRKAEQLLRRTLPRIIEMDHFGAEDLWTINADPRQIEQILLNLAVNAKDAMPRGGRIVIETENVTLDEDYCRSHLGVGPGDYVLLTFSDTGIGIYPDVLDHIFEPFFTTKKTGEGTGLGLATVYGIVKQHNGHIICYSEPENGTTFKIYLPAIRSEDVETSGQFRVLPAGGTETILLADDEELIRDLGERILSRAGYTVLTACDGQEALEIYQKEMSKIHLVILDLIMPVMEGAECMNELARINPSVKVIVASGHSANGPAKRATKAGAKGFIRKPFDIRQMLEVVREVLDAE